MNFMLRLFIKVICMDSLKLKNIFDQNSQIVVDPNEEKLKNEFKGVQRSYIPINCIMRIDEVG